MQYDESGLSGPYIMEELYRITDGKAIITTEVGQHQMWAAQYYKYTKPRTFINLRRSGNHGIWFGRGHRRKDGTPGSDRNQRGGETDVFE